MNDGAASVRRGTWCATGELGRAPVVRVWAVAVPEQGVPGDGAVVLGKKIKVGRCELHSVDS